MYLNSIQHDAPITSVERSKRDFTIWMDDDQVSALSSTLEAISSGRLEIARGLYPVGFRFCDVSSISISRINRNDKILPLSVPKYLPQLNEFYYDEVTSISPECFSMGMQILTRGCRGSYIDPLLVEVKCRKLEFVEGQRVPFEALYGNQYPGLFDAFEVERRAKRRYFDSCTVLRKFVLEEFGGTNPVGSVP